MKNDVCAIVQARLGSTRMPNKVLLPFFGENTILDIILAKFKRIGLPVVVATSVNQRDDAIVAFCKQRAVRCFRGPEQDVLARFVECAEYFGISKIIRICSDNPFLSEKELFRLTEAVSSEVCDYMSFDVGGVPSIRTHFGFWAEYVTLDTLHEVLRLVPSDSIYREHVTNYIYTHDDIFRVRWLDTPVGISSRQDIRLTIDTPVDFRNISELYTRLTELNKGLEADMAEVLAYLDAYPEFRQVMLSEIKSNSK